MVQVGHVCLEAGRAFEWSDHTHMVVLSIADENKLLECKTLLEQQSIKSQMFFEPDDDMKFTAICTEPIYGEQRNIFRKYRLWKQPLSSLP